MSKEQPKNQSKIRSMIRERAEERGIKSSYGLQKLLNVAPTVAVNLWNDDVTRFSVETLQLLCEKFGVDVGELLVYRKNENDVADAPQSAKREGVKPKSKKPAKRDETKRAATSAGYVLTIKDVIARLKEATGNELSRQRISDYISDGVLKSIQPEGERRPRLISESDYLEFENWYKENVAKEK